METSCDAEKLGETGARRRYPSGGPGFWTKMSATHPDEPLSMIYYTNGFVDPCDGPCKDYEMVSCNGGLEPHPNASHDFHKDLMTSLQAFGLGMLFTDFLCYRGPGMAAYTDLEEGENGEHLWLAGIASAALELGVEVQFCMALAHQILATLEWPSVTNARINGDGGLAVPRPSNSHPWPSG